MTMIDSLLTMLQYQGTENTNDTITIVHTVSSPKHRRRGARTILANKKDATTTLLVCYSKFKNRRKHVFSRLFQHLKKALKKSVFHDFKRHEI